MLLEGKRAIVTGGNAGIGKAVALAYAKEGAAVFVCARSGDKNRQVVDEIAASGGQAFSAVCDVSVPEDVERALDAARESMGGIDILANIAGVSPKGPDGMKIPFFELDVDTWDDVIRVNLSSAFYMSRLVARDMIRQRYGKIVNMSSIVGLTGSEHGPAAACYSASKAGIVSLTRSMGYELAEYNITVNAVAPGRTESAMSSANNELYNRRNLNDIPIKRFGRPGEIADLFVFYASDKSSYIIGETTVITGGWLIR